MKIGIIFSESISHINAQSFIRYDKTRIAWATKVKAVYLVDGAFDRRTSWNDSWATNKHCFDFCKRNGFTPIYITIL